MKLKLKLYVFIVLALAAVFTGCEPLELDPASSSPLNPKDATITGFTLTADGTTVTGRSKGTPQATWNNSSITAGKVYLTSAQAGVNKITAFTATGPTGATMKYAYTASSGTTAGDPTAATAATTGDQSFIATWPATGNAAVIAVGNFFWIQCTSKDGSTVKVYQIGVGIDSDAAIKDYTLGGVAGDTSAHLGTPASAYSGATAGAITLTSTQATTAAFSATAYDTQTGVDVKYATTSGTGTPTFTSWTATTIANNDFVWIECTAKDTTTKLVYKIKVTVGP